MNRNYKQNNPKATQNLIQLNQNKANIRKLTSLNKHNYFSIMKSLAEEREKVNQKLIERKKPQPNFIQELYLKYSSNIEQYFNSHKNNVKMYGSHIYQNEPVEVALNKMVDNKKKVVAKIQKREFTNRIPSFKEMDEHIVLTPLPNKYRKYLKEGEKEELINAERKVVVMRTVEYTHAVRKGERKNMQSNEYLYYIRNNSKEKNNNNFKFDRHSLSKGRKGYKEEVVTRSVSVDNDNNDVLIRIKKPVDIIQIWWKGIKRKRERIKEAQSKQDNEKVEDNNIITNSNTTNNNIIITNINNNNKTNNNINTNGKSENVLKLKDNMESIRSKTPKMQNENIIKIKYYSIGLNFIKGVLSRRKNTLLKKVFDTLKQKNEFKKPIKEIEECKYDELMFLGIYKKRYITYPSIYTKENFLNDNKSKKISKIILIQRLFRKILLKKKELSNQNKEKEKNNTIISNKLMNIEHQYDLLIISNNKSKKNDSEINDLNSKENIQKEFIDQELRKNFFLTTEKIQSFELCKLKENKEIPHKEDNYLNSVRQSFDVKTEENKNKIDIENNKSIIRPILLPSSITKETYSSSYKSNIHFIQSKFRAKRKELQPVKYINNNDIYFIPQCSLCYISKIQKSKQLIKTQKDQLSNIISEGSFSFFKIQRDEYPSPLLAKSFDYSPENLSNSPKIPERANKYTSIQPSPCRSDDGFTNSKYTNCRTNILKRIQLKNKKKNEGNKIGLSFNLNFDKVRSLKFYSRKKLLTLLYNIFNSQMRKYLYQIYSYNPKNQKLINILFIKQNSFKNYFTIWKNESKNSVPVYLKKRVCNIDHSTVMMRNKIMQLIYTISSVVNRNFFYRLVLVYLFKEKIDINDNAIVSFIKKGFSYGYLNTLGNILKLNLTYNFFYCDIKRCFIAYMDQIDKMNTEDNVNIVNRFTRSINIELKDMEENEEDKGDNSCSSMKRMKRKDIILKNIISKK